MFFFVQCGKICVKIYWAKVSKTIEEGNGGIIFETFKIASTDSRMIFCKLSDDAVLWKQNTVCVEYYILENNNVPNQLTVVFLHFVLRMWNNLAYG